MKIGIVGCSGKMGKAIVEQILLNENTEIAGGTVKPDSEFLGLDIGSLANSEALGINTGSNLEHLFNASNVVIDFSTPTTSLKAGKIAANTNTPLVIGTTGFTNKERDELVSLGKETTIVWSANMSIGVNLLFALTEQVSAILDDSYDIEIVEMHHYQKVDAPSGTALFLGEAAAKGRKQNLDDVATKSREGIIPARKRGEIGFATIRGGDVVGEHSVIFAGDGERIELTHKASSRKIFAKGAVTAALWTKGKENGLYSMGDVLIK